ncbi:MAG: Fic family protein [Salinivirgaceae bacterium]|nr:Fic family protein [Salinivirgaceae bacterium]
MTNKLSIRFFKDREVRAIWNDDESKWYFSVLDIIGAINEQDDYQKNRNYWKYLKTKIRKESSELVSGANQLNGAINRMKLKAADGKSYLTDVVDQAGVELLAKKIPNNRANEFLDWFTYSDNSIDGQSRKKAYSLWESNLIAENEVGTVKALQKIHAFLFGGLYDFAGKIRTKTISKGGTLFCRAEYLPQNLEIIEQMPQKTFDEIVDKYVEMNMAHPFMEGNGRSTRIWLDIIFKQSLKQCVDWSKIDKKAYLNAMHASTTDSKPIKSLLKQALTDQIADRELFMKGIDYSYYYEQTE